MEGSSNRHFRQQLVDAYLQRAGSFRKLFTSLLAFTAAFGFLVAWPYLATVQQERALAGELAGLEHQQEVLSQQEASFAEPGKQMRILEEQIKSGPNQLRSYILTIDQGRPFRYPAVTPACRALTDPSASRPDTVQIQQLSIQQAVAPTTSPESAPDACGTGDSRQRKVCRIDRFVQYQLCEHEQFFTGSLLPSLARLSDEETPLFDQAVLTRQFEQLGQALRQHVADNPTFWHTLHGKGEMGGQLEEEISTHWSRIEQRLKPAIDKLLTARRAAKARHKQLIEQTGLIKAERDKLGKRLDQIESPVGNLPIGLTESVLLFPVVLVIGFAMATSGLLEQLRLRAALARSETAIQAEETVLSSRQLASVAPLWLESEQAMPIRLLRWLLLLLPALAFIGTTAAILVHSRNTGLLEQAVVGRWVYPALYLAGLVCLAACLWLIRRALQRLDRPAR